MLCLGPFTSIIVLTQAFPAVALYTFMVKFASLWVDTVTELFSYYNFPEILILSPVAPSNKRSKKKSLSLAPFYTSSGLRFGPLLEARFHVSKRVVLSSREKDFLRNFRIISQKNMDKSQNL